MANAMNSQACNFGFCAQTFSDSVYTMNTVQDTEYANVTGSKQQWLQKWIDPEPPHPKKDAAK